MQRACGWTTLFSVYRVLHVLGLIVFTSSSSTIAHAYHVHASGNFYTYDNGNVVPLAFARVEIMDSDSDTDTILDDTMGTGNTDQNGHFEIDGSGGDGGNFWWSKPDVYARVDLSDDYPGPLPPVYGGKPHPVRCTDELNSARGKDTPEHDHDNVSGFVDLGSFVWGDKGQATAPSVWLRSRAAYMDYVNRFHSIPPAGYYDIEYWSGIWTGTPWTNLDTTHWPRHYPTGLSGETCFHEFAHSIRHSFDGGQNHFNWDVTRFTYARYHDICDQTNDGFAFNEGWAEYWDGSDCSKSLQLDFEIEGDVANALAQVAQCCEAGAAGLLQVLHYNPGRIHSFEEFRKYYELRFHDGCAANVHLPSKIASRDVPESITWEQQSQWVMGESAAQSSYITTLGQSLQAALNAAGEINVANEQDRGYLAFQTLIRPHLIQAGIATRLLAKQRIDVEIENKDLVAAHLADGTFSRWYAKEKQEYLQAVAKVNLAALRRARQAVQPLRKYPEGRILVRELQRKVSTLEKLVASGGRPPLVMQPTVLTDAPIVKVSQ